MSLHNLIVRGVSAGAMLLVPGLALAQVSGGVTSLNGLILFLRTAINAIIPILIGLAVLFFIWGLLKYILSVGDEEEQKKARSIMIWGVIIIFVMISIWGLINFLVNTFGLQNTPTGNLPQVPF